jgi:hypothetical protein
MVQAIMKLDDYSARVLDVVKGKYGLKNRNDALNKFIMEFGSEFVDVPVDEKYLIELDNKIGNHYNEFGTKGMTEKELDEVLNL